MSRARSLSAEESARVRVVLERLFAKFGSQAAVAEQLKMPDGSSVSQASVSLVLRGGAVGVTLARAIAMRLGMGFEELVGGSPPKADGLRRYRDLPGWSEAVEKVAAEQLLPRYVLAAAGETLVSFPVKQVDAGLVYDQGVLWLKHAPLDVRKAAEKADILQERAAQEAKDRDRYEALRTSDELSAQEPDSASRKANGA